MTSQFVDIADGHLWCIHDTATSGPTVVFIHGFSVDHRMWSAQSAALNGVASTLTYDLRGFGRSGLPDPRHDHVSDVIDVFARLTIDHAVIVGLSLGANIALALTVQRPDLVDAVVLASPGLPGRTWTSPRPPDLAAAHAREHGIDSAREFWLSLDHLSAPGVEPEAQTQLRQMVADFPAHQWSASGPASRPLPALDGSLETIVRPVTVISGEHDDPGYLLIAEEFAARVPDVNGVVVADAGHFVNLDQPAQFNALVREVVDSSYGSTSRIST